MNVKRILIPLIIFTALLTGCTGEKKPEAVTDSIQEYFPIKENTHYEYQGIGTPAAAQQIFNTYINGSTVQRYLLSSSAQSTDVLSLSDGQLTLVYGESYGYYVEDLTGVEPRMPMTLLKEPLTLGAQWDVDENGSKSEITNMAVTVETPYGTFEAMEVSSIYNSYGNVFAQQDYYAKGIGLIKTIYGKEDGPAIGCELVAISEDTSLALPFAYFNPVVTDSDYASIPELRNLELHTNDNLVKALEAQFQMVTEEEFQPVISANTKINSIVPDRDNDRMTVDFSKEFVSEMNAGGGYEVRILQSIVNTLGNLYRVHEVRILVDGKGYESGHIAMAQDEYMTVEGAQE